MDRGVLIQTENTMLVESRVINGISTPITSIKSLKTIEYLKNIGEKLGRLETDILPRGCRYVKRIDNETTIYVIEEAPRIKSTRFELNFARELATIKTSGQEYLNVDRFLKNKKMPISLKLSFPYIIYIMIIRNRKSNQFEVPAFEVFFRKHPIRDIGDYLFIANLFNLSEYNALCFGSHEPYYKSNFNSTSDLADYLVNSFWHKSFSSDYRSRHEMYVKDPIMHTFLTWADRTERDPHFILSVDFIMHNNNIKEEIENAEKYYIKSFDNVHSSIFVNSTDIKSEEGCLKTSYNYDNIKMSSQVLSMGDMIKYENEYKYIYNIIGNGDGPTHITLINDLDEVSDPIIITSELTNDWSRQITEQLTNYKEEIDYGGKHAKVGNIIKIIPTNSYDVIRGIRKTRDGRYEFILSKKFYIVSQDTFEVIESFLVNGIELKHNHDYIICNNQYQIAFRGKLSRISTNSYGILYLFFQDLFNNGENGERGVSVTTLEDRDSSIYKISELRDLPLFCYFDMLYINKDNQYMIMNDRLVYTDYRTNHDNEKFTRCYEHKEFVRNNILLDDDKRLFIPGVCKDIEFNIGDKFVVGNWENSDLMFNIKTITGFDIYNDIIRIKSIDQEGNERSFSYIDLTTGIISVGYIRKVVDNLNGIQAGSIIRSSVSGHFNFPKSENHKISAFIVDSDKPLVLCESGFTIWIDELENFDVFAPGSRRYNLIKKIQTLDPSKIKWQTGDICKTAGSNELWMYYKNTYMGHIYMKINPSFIKSGSLKDRSIISEEIDESFQRTGIIDPRYKESGSRIKYEVMPTLHNGYRDIPFNGYYPCTIKLQGELS